MENKTNALLKLAMPHFVGVFILMCCAFGYFAPSVGGKVLQQSDNIQAYGMQAEMKKYIDKGEHKPLWTNSCFSGMPTYQILGGAGKNLMVHVYRGMVLWNSVTVAHTAIFLVLIGFYIMLVMFKVDWWLAVIGALSMGFMSSNIQLIEAGHSTKLIAVAYIAPLIGSIYMTFKGRLVLGTSLTAFFMSLQVIANHLQITYYTLMMLGLFGIFMIAEAAKNKELPALLKPTLLVAAAVALGFMVTTSQMWTTSEYSVETQRGKADLSNAEVKDGLTKDYIFGWSLGVGESLSLLVPNVRGSSSNEYFYSDPESNCYAVVASSQDNQQRQQLAQASSQYWGNQPFTGGAVYYGAILCFLFLLGAILVDGGLKWWLVSSFILMLMLAWGDNFSMFNYAMYDYFPMFRKFRAVNMAVSVGQVPFYLLATLGLKELVYGKKLLKDKQMALYISAGATLGICLLLLVMSGSFDYGVEKAPAALKAALAADRAAILKSDAFRSMGFILVAAGLIWLYLADYLKAIYALPMVGLLAAIDLWGIDLRNLTHDDFVPKTQVQAVSNPRPVDLSVMKDPDPHYRVYDLSRGSNPFSDARPSYFHKSIGGYHAVKLMLFENLKNYYFTRDLQTGNPLQHQNLLKMLNVKYAIVPDQQAGGARAMQLTPFGNAWFVQDAQIVENADAEFAALDQFEPGTVALVQKKYADYVAGTNSKNGSDRIKLSSYHPDKMVYEYSCSADRLAIFSEVYYPPSKGWKVFIDGNLVPEGFIKADYLLRGLRVPAGSGVIEMRFEPTSYYTGEMITLFASLLVLIGFAFGMYFTFTKTDWNTVLSARNEHWSVLFPQEAKKDLRATTSKVNRKTGRKK